MDLRVKVDTSDLDRRLIGMEKQIPFATSLALNLTASQAMLTVRSNLKRYFTIRTPWVAKGIRMKKSVKGSQSRGIEQSMSAYVYTMDDYLEQQIEGGPRAKKGKHSARPLIGGRRPRTTIMDVTRRSEFPAQLAKKPGYFIATLRTKAPSGKTYGVWRRVLRDKAGDVVSRKVDPTTGRFGLSAGMLRMAEAKQGLELMYDMKAQVMIKPRWPLLEQVEEVFAARWAENTAQAVTRALATAK